MQAGEQACACPDCGVVCEGLFDGCPAVWARGPRPVDFVGAAIPSRPAPTRALYAGPAPSSGAPSSSSGSASSGPSPLANGFSGPPPSAPRATGRVAPPPPPPPPLPPPPQQPGAGPRADVLHWFEDAFDELRHELHSVVSTVTRQQAMLAELLDTREAELRVVMVAETLPELAGEAAAKALADQTGGLAEVVEARLEEFRIMAEASDQSAVAVMDGMRERLRRVELAADLDVQAANHEGALRLEALKSSVARQLKPVVAAVAQVAAHVDEAQEREAARGRALRASVTKQLQPLATALDAAMERSDRQLAEIRERLDAIAGPAATKPGPKPRANRRTST